MNIKEYKGITKPEYLLDSYSHRSFQTTRKLFEQMLHIVCVILVLFTGTCCIVFVLTDFTVWLVVLGA